MSRPIRNADPTLRLAVERARLTERRRLARRSACRAVSPDGQLALDLTPRADPEITEAQAACFD